ncbi:hypothetical protein Tco_0652184 [Tanacetum coccineum]|uniref:Uncharacterized protein n=1 Tax=Tanacetum coccineum TaxID=301880 RepID=A0ABQ4WXH8_9ASTR
MWNPSFFKLENAVHLNKDEGILGLKTTWFPHTADCVILLAVYSSFKSGRKLMSWRRYDGDCRDSDDCANLPGRILRQPIEGLLWNLGMVGCKRTSASQKKVIYDAESREENGGVVGHSRISLYGLKGNRKLKKAGTDIQEKDKKKAKSKQFQARSRKGQSQKSAKQENTT